MGKFRQVTYDDLGLRRFYLHQICRGIRPDVAVADVAFEIRGKSDLEEAMKSYLVGLRASYDPDQPDVTLFEKRISVEEVITHRKKDIFKLTADMESRLERAKAAVVRRYGAKHSWIKNQSPESLFEELINVFGKRLGHYDPPFVRFFKGLLGGPEY